MEEGEKYTGGNFEETELQVVNETGNLTDMGCSDAAPLRSQGYVVELQASQEKKSRQDAGVT